MVRRFGLALICGCCFWLAGCHVPKSANSSPSAGQASVSQEKPADTVEFYVAFVERRLGEPFLNNEEEESEADAAEEPAAQACLWSSTDHHVVNIDHKIALEENGYRVGQIVGVIPARLITLLESEKACVNARYRLLPCGAPATLHLGPESPRSSFEVKIGGQSQQITLEQAQFCLDVTASLTKDGRTKLEFTPKIEHRQSAFPVDLSPDLTGYVKQTAKPYRSFPQMGWHVALTPGATLVIGANLDKPGTLGYRSFTQEDIAEPLQRVLILCTSRPLDDLDDPAVRN